MKKTSIPGRAGRRRDPGPGIAARLGARFRFGSMGRHSGDFDSTDQEFAVRRRLMVEEQIAGRGVRDAHVLEAMGRVLRHEFVPSESLANAYDDRPLPIGRGQTLSQPYIVALMSEALGLEGHETVLEIGTGSGYQTAVLARLARQVYSLEILPELLEGARRALERSGCTNVLLRVGDGNEGWPEAAPFDACIVTAAPAQPPERLLDQLRPGGRLVVPVGPLDIQELLRIVRTGSGFEQTAIASVRFVPMVGNGRRRNDP